MAALIGLTNNETKGKSNDLSEDLKENSGLIRVGKVSWSRFLVTAVTVCKYKLLRSVTTLSSSAKRPTNISGVVCAHVTLFGLERIPSCALSTCFFKLLKLYALQSFHPRHFKLQANFI